MDEPSESFGGSALEAQTDRHPRATGELSVLLIGNYGPDGQQSMQRFAAVMEKELSALGVDTTVIRPEPFFGRLRPGATGLGKWLGYLDKFFVFPRVLQKMIATLRTRPSTRLVVHICDHSNAHYTRYLRDVPHVVTCHDLLAVRSALGEIPQNPTRWSGRVQQRLVIRGLERARAIGCDSAATHRDVSRIVRGAKARSSVVSIGLNAPFRPVPSAEARARVLEMMRKAGHSPDPGVRFIVHIGGDQWYKNRKGVVDIFCELRRASDQGDLRLMMVGKPLNSELKLRIEESGLGDRVIELPGVSHDDLCAIYSAAELLLFPSLQEGFGWPVIEAQACGCRVVTTGRPPMSDIGGDAAAYLVPEDIHASLDVLLNVLYEDERRREERVERGLANVKRYSTREMVDGYLATYDRVARGTS